MAANMAGTPNLNTVGQLIFLLKRVNLNRLETKCTIAAAAIAKGSGKKSAKTGSKRVDNPKPE
jgi:hypothetical protein